MTNTACQQHIQIVVRVLIIIKTPFESRQN